MQVDKVRLVFSVGNSHAVLISKARTTARTIFSQYQVKCTRANQRRFGGKMW